MPFFDLHAIAALILDIDGILYEGQRALPGAVELIAQLTREGTPYVLLSNNTTRPLRSHLAQLTELGMPVPPGSIVTAAYVVAHILAGEARPGTRCLVIGETGLLEALEQVGLRVTQTDSDGVEYVVVGMDRQLSYEKLKAAALAIQSGAKFISSNPDPAYPDGKDLIPASGAIQAALEAATRVRARVTGKPELPGFQIALGQLGSTPNQTAMLGDQLETDILGAKRAGLKGFLVLSSLTPNFVSDRAPVQPDAIFESTSDFYRQWLAR
jgi:HAD superfamily hydrolase (TIGR01450 family)